MLLIQTNWEHTGSIGLIFIRLSCAVKGRINLQVVCLEYIVVMHIRPAGLVQKRKRKKYGTHILKHQACIKSTPIRSLHTLFFVVTGDVLLND